MFYPVQLATCNLSAWEHPVLDEVGQQDQDYRLWSRAKIWTNEEATDPLRHPWVRGSRGILFCFIIFKSFHLGFSEFSLCSYILQLPSKVVNFEPIGYSTDMWALGVITYVLWVSSRIIEHPIWVFFVTYILWASFITHMRSVSIFKPLIKSFFCGPIRLTESRLRRLDLEGGRINQAILLMLALTWFWYSKSFFNFFVFILIWHTSINMAFIPWASLS